MGDQLSGFSSLRVLVRAVQRQWQRFRDWLWAYDFFISYHWKSGKDYAVALCDALRKSGFEVFLDRTEFAAGEDYSIETQRALRSTQRLIIVATKEALTISDAVADEVEQFAGLKRVIIPIVFGVAINDDAALPSRVLKYLPKKQLHIKEKTDRLAEGPTPEAIDDLKKSYNVLRRRTRRLQFMLGSAVTLLLAIVLAIVAIDNALKQSEMRLAGLNTNRLENGIAYWQGGDYSGALPWFNAVLDSGIAKNDKTRVTTEMRYRFSDRYLAKPEVAWSESPHPLASVLTESGSLALVWPKRSRANGTPFDLGKAHNIRTDSFESNWRPDVRTDVYLSNDGKRLFAFDSDGAQSLRSSEKLTMDQFARLKKSFFVWDCDTGKQLFKGQLSTAPNPSQSTFEFSMLLQGQLSNTGQFLMFLYHDGKPRLFNLASETEIRLKGVDKMRHALNAAVFSPKSDRLYAANKYGEWAEWKTDSGNLVGLWKLDSVSGAAQMEEILDDPLEGIAPTESAVDSQALVAVSSDASRLALLDQNGNITISEIPSGKTFLKQSLGSAEPFLSIEWVSISFPSHSRDTVYAIAKDKQNGTFPSQGKSDLVFLHTIRAHGSTSCVRKVVPLHQRADLLRNWGGPLSFQDFVVSGDGKRLFQKSLDPLTNNSEREPTSVIETWDTESGVQIASLRQPMAVSSFSTDKLGRRLLVISNDRSEGVPAPAADPSETFTNAPDNFPPEGTRSYYCIWSCDECGPKHDIVALNVIYAELNDRGDMIVTADVHNKVIVRPCDSLDDIVFETNGYMPTWLAGSELAVPHLDGSIALFEFKGKAIEKRQVSLPEHRRVVKLAKSRNLQSLIFLDDKSTCWLQSIGAKAPSEISKLSDEPISSVAFVDESTIGCIRKDGSLQLYDAITKLKFGAPIKHSTEGGSGTTKLLPINGCIRISSRVCTFAGPIEQYSVIADYSLRFWDRSGLPDEPAQIVHPGLILQCQQVPGHPSEIVTTCGKFVRCWDVNTGKPIVALEHASDVQGVATSPDGSLLASITRDKTVSIWDLATGMPISFGMPYSGGLRGLHVDTNAVRVVTLALSNNTNPNSQLRSGTVELWQWQLAEDRLPTRANSLQIHTEAISGRRLNEATGELMELPLGELQQQIGRLPTHGLSHVD